MTYQLSIDERYVYDHAPGRYYDGGLPPFIPTQLGTSQAAYGKVDIFGDEDVYAIGDFLYGSILNVGVDGVIWDDTAYNPHALSTANILVVDQLGRVVGSGSFFDSPYGPQPFSLVAPRAGSYYVVVDSTYADGQYKLTLSVSGGIVNLDPVAVDDFYSINQGQPVLIEAATGLLFNDYDPDGGTISVVEFAYLGSGQLAVGSDGSFVYTPGPGFVGQDGFAYTVEDQYGARDTGVVTITVVESEGLNGSIGPDIRVGTTGDDDISLLAGDDTFYGSLGNDRIDGGPNADIVRYPDVRSGFGVDLKPDGEVRVEKPVPGTDTLVAVERIEFLDGALLLDLDSENAAFVYRVYAAAYGRTPDEAGLRFWTDVMDDRGGGPPDAADQAFLAGFFLTANEFINLYGANPSDFQYVDAMYQNVLGRLPDQAGYDFWVGAMQQGLGRDDILISFAESGENLAQTAPDIDNGFWVL